MAGICARSFDSGRGVLGLAYLAQVLSRKGPLAALDLNTYNLLFLMMGLAAALAAAIVRARRERCGSGDGRSPHSVSVLRRNFWNHHVLGDLAAKLAHFFVSFSSTNTYPIVVSIYSAILGMFVPSGGSKWIIEAPYVLQAAKDLHVNLGWVVQIYNTSEALPNLINPFWMLPLLGLLKVKARDLIGYGMLYFMVNFVLVLFLMWFFARTFPYVPPIIP